MFGRKNNDKSVDYKNLNEVILLSKKILKIAFFLIIVTLLRCYLKNGKFLILYIV